MRTTHLGDVLIEDSSQAQGQDVFVCEVRIRLWSAVLCGRTFPHPQWLERMEHPKQGGSFMVKRDKLCCSSVTSPGQAQIGLGIGLFALAMAGTAGPWLNSELEKNKVRWMDPVTPEPPKPEPQQVKPPTGIKRASTMPVKPPTFKKD